MTVVERPLGGLASRGAVSLVGRQAIAFFGSLLCGIFLARILSPSDFGAYAYMLFVQSLAKLLIDGGLTATLVRQPEEPTAQQWRSVFSLQLLLAAVLAVAVLVGTRLLVHTFDAVPHFTVANALTAASLLVAPMLSICFARLERALRFDRIGLLSLVQPLVFSVLAPILAAVGLGAIALGLGILVSTLVALAVALPVTGAPPALTLHLSGIRDRLRFSTAYVGSGLLSVVKDAVNPLLVGAVVGAAAVGYIRWSQQTAALAVYLVGATVPMLFAVFARVQHEPERLGRATSRAIFWANALTAPLAILLTVFIQPITADLYGEKWLAALPLYLLLALTNLISPTTTVLLALCNAIGRPTVPLIFISLWFGGTWLFTSLLVVPLGVLGYGVANALVGLFGIALIVVAKRIVPHRILRPMAVPWLAAAAACAPAFAVQAVAGELPLPVVAALGAASLALFAGAIRLVAPSEFDSVRRSLTARLG